MAITGLGDAQDYAGGQPVAKRVLCVDAGAHFTQHKNILVDNTGVGFFSTAPVAQQAFLAALSTALTSVDGASSATLALALNSINLTANSINLYLQRFGLQSTA